MDLRFGNLSYFWELRWMKECCISINVSPQVNNETVNRKQKNIYFDNEKLLFMLSMKTLQYKSTGEQCYSIPYVTNIMALHTSVMGK